MSESIRWYFAFQMLTLFLIENYVFKIYWFNSYFYRSLRRNVVASSNGGSKRRGRTETSDGLTPKKIPPKILPPSRTAVLILPSQIHAHHPRKTVAAMTNHRIWPLAAALKTLVLLPQQTVVIMITAFVTVTPLPAAKHVCFYRRHAKYSAPPRTSDI